MGMQDVLNDCIVAVIVNGEIVGTAFYVSANTLATAAHVVADVSATDVMEVGDHEGSARVRTVYVSPRGSSSRAEIYPYPDLALLRVEGTSQKSGFNSTTRLPTPPLTQSGITRSDILVASAMGE